jgi:hypothetical protein
VALSALDDRTQPPTDQSLRDVLGRASDLWTALRNGLQADHGPLAEEWNFAGTKYGWSLRLKQKKRALVYLTPCHSSFLASFALGEKACRVARASGLPAPILELIERAPKYAEGRGVRIPVRRRRDLAGVRKLVAIKAEN